MRFEIPTAAVALSTDKKEQNRALNGRARMIPSLSFERLKQTIGINMERVNLTKVKRIVDAYRMTLGTYSPVTYDRVKQVACHLCIPHRQIDLVRAEALLREYRCTGNYPASILNK